MKKLPVILAAAFLAAPAFVQAQNQPQAAVVVEKAPGAGAVTEVVQLQGKVKSIDKKKRAVVVVGPNGNEIVFNASADVRNFDQIKVGDLVTLTYAQALALELKKAANKGVRERVDTENALAAKPGEKPGMMVEKSVRVIADVVAVNPKAQTVTLKGPKRTVELHVKDPAQFQNAKVGDQVEVLYVEAVALEVSAAKAKPKAK
jgi:ethanolamine utilization protein EutQ (cupin superfamily)